MCNMVELKGTICMGDRPAECVCQWQPNATRRGDIAPNVPVRLAADGMLRQDYYGSAPIPTAWASAYLHVIAVGMVCGVGIHGPAEASRLISYRDGRPQTADPAQALTSLRPLLMYGLRCTSNGWREQQWSFRSWPR